MNITLTDISGDKMYIIPIVPDNIDMKMGGKNETLDTLNGEVRLVGDMRLKEIAWESFFPVNKKYSFVAPDSLTNGYDYIDFIETMLEAEIPVRVVVTTDDKRSIQNMLATIDEGFSHKIDKAGDIQYSIKLTEFPAKLWDYVNSSKEAQSYLNSLKEESAAKKDLTKHGLI